MLVLSRKDGQSIHIGSDIVVKVSQVNGSRVKLAIEAPREVPIRRAEIAEKPAQSATLDRSEMSVELRRAS
ncbi:carbon storage regulator [Roseiconus nitratireducens]|uniref:Translational regulator CsrA n=1 Tax=Roseiconus nitratireducens TaxID=2605748 RepID=A0A5M6DGW8_9BACT|nr:carbon storage regulator [Roseiconus nitratireducens]KAA5545449.1 carbon storage regulator [Roseiconus nitratireducens]